MKKIFLLITLALYTTMMNAAVKVDRIDPTFWYAGMKNPTVQLMLYGKNVKQAEVTTDYPGATIERIVQLDSPNYLLVYLNLSGAQPGEMTLKVDGKKVKYQLKQREKAGAERHGFTNEDVLYMLMPDRFASGSSDNDQIKGMNTYKNDRTQPSLRHGGDLEGIRRHLDYFNQLGVTALWFTPVLENNSPDSDNGFSTYHGYAATDYYRVDPRFGTNEEYKRLTDEAHAKGLKIVMDMIFNHCGLEHPWVEDMPSKDWLNTPEWLQKAKQEGKKETNDLYLQTSYKLTPVLDPYASKVDLKETVDGWFVPSMPDLNQKNPHVITYLIQNSIWWIETVGIDGIRMDTYPYADAKAMAKWMKQLNDEYPNFNVVGETWVTEPAYTAAWQDRADNSDCCCKNGKCCCSEGSGSSCCDKKGDSCGKAKDSCGKNGGSCGNGGCDKKDAATPLGGRTYLKSVMDFSFFDKLNMAKNEETDDWWKGYNRIYNSFVYDYLYPNPSSVMAFIENHDTDRFLGNGRDTLALKQALALLLTVNRIPQLYYGTEILMNGTKEVTDGNVRKDFPGGFPGDTHNAFTAEGRTKAENAMFNWLSRLLHWRKGNSVITKGSQTQFIPYQGVYVIARQYNGKTVLTVLNGKSETATMSVKRYAEVIGGNARVKDVLTNRYYDLSKDLELRPRQVLVLELN